MFLKKTFFNLLRIILIGLPLNPILPAESQVYLTEGFESGAKPVGWTEEFITGTEPWRFRNGGHSPNDNNWLVPPGQKDITRNPPAAFEGTFNAIFFKQGDGNERTMLVTPGLNLLGAADLELSFYLCQIPWTFDGSSGWDVLRVWYKVSQSSPWVLLHEYLDPLYAWTQQTLVLPNPSSTYYIGFEGQTRWGYGTCIDKITVESKGLKPYWIRDIDFEQLFPKSIPSGTFNVPMMRIGFTVLGNTGNAILDKIRFISLNTSDSDIKPGGIKLYSTVTQKFNTDKQLGTPADFISGAAEFSGLNHSLPPGQSYLWLTYDVDTGAVNGNILDAKVSAKGILANDSLYPSVEKSPEGFRVIYKTQYFEGFESVHNWNLTGEFEVNSPAGKGGFPGNPDPAAAFSGSKELGSDLTGLGSHPYNYENSIGEAAINMATSPVMDLFFYKNLNLFFQRYLNIEVWDNSSIQVSTDSGSSWNTIWKNNSYINDFQWVNQQIQVPEAYSRTSRFRLRFQLGPTDVQNSYSGWNIDDIYITGEFISKDAGISEWIYPLSGTGHTSNDSITVRIRNYGGADITDPVPVSFSFDGGSSWVTDIMYRDIPVGGSVLFTFPTRTDLSSPGSRTALAKTVFPGDQFSGNDALSVPLYIIPTYRPPYSENFEKNDGYWRAGGNKIWEHGLPAGNIINSASSGEKVWLTGLNSTYGDLIARKNKIILQDDFESDHGWTFSGEFERNIPNYGFLPYFASSGYYCIGTDLSGRGTSAYKYENGISPASAYTAVSPAFDVRNYSNLTVSYLSWITIQQGDSIKFEVSPDNGLNWYKIWNNSEGSILEEGFTFREYHLPEQFNNSPSLKFRFSLYRSSASGPVAQGWSIDDFLFTGDLVNTEECLLTSPGFDLTGLSFPVFESKLWLDTEKNADGASLQYSLDDGATWTTITNSCPFDSYWNWYTGQAVSALNTEGWSGQSNGWMTVRHLLPPALTGQPDVQLRVRFMADKINNQFDGIAIDDARIIEAPADLGVIEILSPLSGCELGDARRLTLRIKNYGIRNLNPGDSIRIGYNINKSGQVQAAEETVFLSQPFPSGSTLDLEMVREFDFSSGGQYQVSVFTVEADPHFYQQASNDTTFRLINVNKPPLELGPDISTARPDQVILNAFSGITGYNYLWQDGSIDSIFHVKAPGKYYVKVTGTNGCTASDTINVLLLIADAGVSGLIAPLSSCLTERQEPFIVKIRNYGTDTLNVNDTIFLSAAVSSDLMHDTLVLKQRLAPGDSLQHTFARLYRFPAPGIYPVNISASLRDDNNQSNDTLKHILEIFKNPSIDLGDDITATAPAYLLTAPAGYSGYLWQNGSTSGSFMADQQGKGLYYVMVTDGNQCTDTDSVYVTLNVTDVAVIRILSPRTSCTSSDTLEVSVRLKNTGSVPVSKGEVIRLSYAFEGGPAGQDSISFLAGFLPGDSIDFIFGRKIRVTGGAWYNFSAALNYKPDMRPGNNALLVPVGMFRNPVVNLGDDYRVVAAIDHVLDAGPGYASYLWSDGSTQRTTTINNPGINTRSVIVTDINGCRGYDEVSIMLAVPDIGLTGIINPKTSCSSAMPGNVQIAVSNTGNWDIDKSADIWVTYSINGQPPVREKIVLNDIFKKGSLINYTFIKQENLNSAGQYRIVAAIEYASDLLASNNMLTSGFDILERPVLNLGHGDTVVVLQPLTLAVPPGYASYRWQDGSSAPDYQVREPGAAMYTVSVTGGNQCISRDSVFVVYDKPDLGINRIVSPVSSCMARAVSKTISVEVINNGYYRIAPDEAINLSYSINDGNIVKKTILPGVPVEPGKTVVLTFDSYHDFGARGVFLIKVTLEKNDNNLSNNTAISTVSIWNTPHVEIGGGKDTLKNVMLPVMLNAGSGFASYLWQDKSVNSRFEAAQDGLFWVIVTDENGCTSHDSVYVMANGRKKFPGNVKIYPNPVREILHMNVEMDQPLDFRIELFNLNSVIYSEDFTNEQYRDINIDVRGFPPGTYFMRITTGSSRYVLKVVVN